MLGYRKTKSESIMILLCSPMYSAKSRKDWIDIYLSNADTSVLHPYIYSLLIYLVACFYNYYSINWCELNGILNQIA